MSEKKLKTLYRLLGEFASAKEINNAGEKVCRDTRITRQITEIREWVKWYARDEESVDI